MVLRRGRGRPAAGLRAGERVRDYPRLTVRVPRRVVDLLERMAAQENTTQWRVLAEAITERASRVLK